MFREPAKGIVPVQVQPPFGGSGLEELSRLIILDHPLGEHPVIGAANVVGFPLYHDPGILVVDFPFPAGIGYPHHEDLAIAIQIQGLHSGAQGGIGIGPVGAAEHLGAGKVSLGPIGRDAGDDVIGGGFEQGGDLVILPVARHQAVCKVNAGHGAGNLPGVMVAVHIIGRLFAVVAGGVIGDGQSPNIPALGGYAGGFQMNQAGVFLRHGLYRCGQFLVFIIMVERELHDKKPP